MLNPIASSEAIYSATYVDNYIDSVENLPDDVQRQLSRIRDIDVQLRAHLRDVDRYYELWKSLPNASDNVRRERATARMQSSLIHAQELGDEKMQIVNLLQELIDLKVRRLDSDQTNLDIKEEQHAAQHQHGLREDVIYSGPNQKVSRSQSPIIGVPAIATVTSNASASNVAQSPTIIGKENSNAFVSVTALVHAGANNTPSGDRANGGNPVISAGGGGIPNINYSNSNSSVPSNNSNNSNTASSSADGRSSNKRSRRQRNDNVNTSAMELGGNESNSANEGGGSGDRGCATGGTAHKQSISNQSSMLGAQKKSNQSASGNTNTSGASTSGGGGGGGSATTSKKKRRKARGGQTSNTQANAREDTPPVDPIDPDEPTYCLCDQISFGEMILCDNDLCPIEWFHFSCVSLVLKPKGKWYCPNCRGDRPNVMKPKAQFLKELERYNKEKEEKT